MKKILLIVFVSLSLYSCRTAKPVTRQEPLPDSTIAAPEIVVKKNPGKELTGLWELQRIWGTDNKFITTYIAIDFDNKTFIGNTGCNSISGKFITNDTYITINKEIISTKMTCPGNIEKSFLSVLLKVNKFHIDNSELEMSQNDIVLLKFNRK